jgi:hypothetical protein
MDTPKTTDFIVVLLNMETHETEAVLCNAETSTQASTFMTEKFSERGMSAIVSFTRKDVLNICLHGQACRARPPLMAEEYTKLRQFVLNDPVLSGHARAFGKGGDEEMHDKLPEFVELYRDNLQEDYARKNPTK